MKSDKNKSQKGKRDGVVGAPPKAVKFPRRKFTVADVVALNAAVVCELTVRKRIEKMVESGEIVEVGTVPQPKGAVGRPSVAFALKDVAATLKTKTPKTPKTPKAKASKPASVPVVTVAPATPTPPPTPTPVSVNTPAPADAVPADKVTPATLP